MSNHIKLVFIKTDSFLDISYYRVKIKYWDGEEVIKENCSSFTFGDVLIPVLKNIDDMNVQTSISIYIEDNEEVKQFMKQLTDQVPVKKSKYKVRQQLTSSTKEADWLKDFINQYQIEVY